VAALDGRVEETVVGLLEAAPDGILAIDARGRIVLVNAQIERLFGYPRDEMVGQPIEMLVPEAARAVHREHRARYERNPYRRPMGAGMQLAGRRRDGTEFPVEISLNAVPTGSGVLFAASVRDVSELQRAEAKFRRLLDAAPDAMLCIDGEGRITLANVEAERVLGFPRDELVGQPVELLVPEVSRGVHVSHRAAYAANPERRPMGAGRQLSVRRRDGSEFPADISLSALETDSGLLVCAAIRDVTERLQVQAEAERVRIEAEQERYESRVQQSQRLESLGQLAGGVAHDFNNLLAVILNYAAFVKEEMSEDDAAAPPEAERWESVISDLDQIELAAQKAARLTHQLLAFARRDVGHPEVVALNSVIVEVQRLLNRTIGEHVVLATNLGEDLWPILADPGQMEQVLVNLAVNARDAMPDGGTLIIETANLDVDEGYAVTRPDVSPGRYVALRVSDTGEGMSDEVLARAFEPFFTTKADREGTGLGLATVYGIVRRHGGYAQLYSEVGIGTTFTALLPATDGEVGTTARAGTRRAPSGGETVLVVEDEEALREVTRRILARHGYEVISAANGKEAIDLIARYDGPLDLLLTDVVMPEMLGERVADEVQQLRPDIQVVFMSGYAEPILGARGALDEGVVLVSKPFSETELLTKIRDALDAPR
jgi:PAS domain S-box-containing protein